jgi:hypothetical protein
VVPPFDGPTVRIEIAEVKPLTHSGIALGEQEVYECYKEAVEDAGARCTEPNLTGTAKAFCDAVQANGRPVTLAKPAGLSWEPEDHVNVEIDGQPREVAVVACEEGIVGYQCVD